MTFTWFLVEYPGISIVSSPLSPIKSHECVVCKALLLLGNTDTTPGISVLLSPTQVIIPKLATTMNIYISIYLYLSLYLRTYKSLSQLYIIQNDFDYSEEHVTV